MSRTCGHAWKVRPVLKMLRDAAGMDAERRLDGGQRRHSRPPASLRHRHRRFMQPLEADQAEFHGLLERGRRAGDVVLRGGAPSSPPREQISLASRTP